MTDLKAALTDEEAEKMARAFDYEDAACRGEPSPWDAAPPLDESDYAWREERLSCARAAWLASPGPALRGEGVKVLDYARQLAQHLADKWYPEAGFIPLDDLYGVVSQIDNMTTGLERKASPSLPPDVKAAVERLTVLAETFKVSGKMARGDDLQSAFASHASAIATLIASHTALTEANERLRAQKQPVPCDHVGWTFAQHGRGCPKCGAIVLDCGD